MHEKYIDYLLEKTLFSHQDLSNIGFCGAEVESEIRDFVQNLLPDGRFKVTHGYILHAVDPDSEPMVSPQVDLIIIDTAVTHSIFSVGKDSTMEIVPVEAVVGVFEIKRTLNKDSLEKSIEHLEKIISAVGINKFDRTRYLPGGIPLSDNIQGGLFSNPIIGVIALDHMKNYFSNTQEKASEIFQRIENISMQIDVVVSFSGLLIAPFDKISGNFLVNNYLPAENIKQVEYAYLNHGNVARASIISRFIGYISAYLSNCSGRRIDTRNYFFNKTTWEAIKISENERIL